MDVSAGSSSPSDAAGAGAADTVRQLERQVERGQLFTHTALGEYSARLEETRIFLHAVLDLLLESGSIAEAELAAAFERVRQELAARGELTGPGIRVRVDPSADGPPAPVEVDCAARLPICRAVCCRLDFALSIAEVESGRVKWDLGRPYFIRHEANGYCTHNDPATLACRLYADRPAVCRGYSCAGDERIWLDFEAMVLNVEWIEAHVKPTGPHFVGPLMRVDEYLASPNRPTRVPPTDPSGRLP